MQVILARAAGFCYGVERAIRLATEAAGEDKRAQTLGPIIHNPQVVNKLAERGIPVINSLAEASGTVVVRTHGASPSTFEEAKARGVKLVDATCPYVIRSQRWARRLTGQGYQVIVVGEKHHPEVLGVVGWAAGRAIVVGSAEEAAALPSMDRVAVIAQTTLQPAEFDRVLRVIAPKAREVRAVATICDATQVRQQAARELAGRVQVVLVVGGRASGNTRRLYEICRDLCEEVYLVETAEEIKAEWFSGKSVVGITAGASTPDWIIKEVTQKVTEIDAKTPAPEDEPKVGEAPAEQPDASSGAGATAAGAADEESPGTQDEQDFAGAFTVPRHGDIVPGRVVQINSDSVLVDVGYKSEGIIPLNELSHRPVASPEQVVQVGQEIMVCVLGVDAQEGQLRLSKRRADEGQAWERVKADFDSKETLEAEVVEVVKGGLVLDIGLRGFMPASQVERGYVSDLGKYLGQRIRARIIELDRHKNRVILSQKIVLEEERQHRREHLWSELEEGQVRQGTVKSLTDFGAFVDLGGVDGLIHISELSFGRVKHPSEVLKVGETIDVKVLRLDREKGKVSLGFKQTLPDPWAAAVAKYPEGSVVTGRVVRLTTFGAFVELEPGIDGLIHISQLADRRVAKPDEVVNPGQEVRVRVLSVKPEEKRISLSLKEAEQEGGW